MFETDEESFEMSIKSFKPLLLIVAAILLHPSASKAQTTFPVETDADSHKITASYVEKSAYAGNGRLEFVITVKAPIVGSAKAEELKLIDVKAGESDGFELTQLRSKLNLQEGIYRIDKYVYNISISEKVVPKVYRLILMFRSPREGDLKGYVNLHVGSAQGQGQLKYIEAKPEQLNLGEKKAYKIKLSNGYPEYTVNVTKIKVDSEPAGIITGVELDEGVQTRVDRNEVVIPDGLAIEPYTTKTVKLILTVNDDMPSLQTWLFGFDDETTKLALEIDYDDGHERKRSLLVEPSVKIRPDDTLLFVTLMVGLLVGTLFKFYLEYLRKKGVITKKGVAGFVLITVVVGFITAIIALAGRVTITAFEKVNVSYDKPSAIFITGIIAALVGVHYLRMWTKKLISDNTSPKE